MGTLDELLDLEHGFWRAADDPAFYEEHVADDALFVLPVGTYDRATTIGSIQQSEPWAAHELSEVRYVDLSGDSGALVYRARASRAGQGEYRALITSVYVRRDGRWLLLLHQQTPASG